MGNQLDLFMTPDERKEYPELISGLMIPNGDIVYKLISGPRHGMWLVRSSKGYKCQLKESLIIAILTNQKQGYPILGNSIFMEYPSHLW